MPAQIHRLMLVAIVLQICGIEPKVIAVIGCSPSDLKGAGGAPQAVNLLATIITPRANEGVLKADPNTCLVTGKDGVWEGRVPVIHLAGMVVSLDEVIGSSVDNRQMGILRHDSGLCGDSVWKFAAWGRLFS